jgi:hypothetical protein
MATYYFSVRSDDEMYSELMSEFDSKMEGYPIGSKIVIMDEAKYSNPLIAIKVINEDSPKSTNTWKLIQDSY